MQGEAQAAYAPLVAGPQAGESPPVRFMGGEVDGLIGVVRRQEAEAIAGAVRTAIEQGWQVRSEEEGGVLRPAAYQDICVLMPRRAGFDALEIAFEEAGIPFRLESASLIYNTQEARDLLNCLAAIDDPTDPVAVVAALRSPAFRLLRRRSAYLRRSGRPVRLPCRRVRPARLCRRRAGGPERVSRMPQMDRSARAHRAVRAGAAAPRVGSR